MKALTAFRVLLVNVSLSLVVACGGDGGSGSDDCGTALCGGGTFAVATAPTKAYAGQTIELNGSGSSSTIGPITYEWERLDGNAVPININNPTAAVASFVAPAVAEETVLRFKLLVNGKNQSNNTSLDITLRPLTVTASSEPKTLTAGGSITLSASGGDESGIKAVHWQRIDNNSASLSLESNDGMTVVLQAGMITESTEATYRVTLTNSHNASVTDEITLALLKGETPHITSVTPSRLALGDSLLVSGSGLSGTQRIVINNQELVRNEHYTVLNDHGIRVTLPVTLPASSGNYELAILSWGGDTARTNISIAQPLTKAVKLAVAQDHACALMENKTIQCWGSNQFGQLGDGTTKNSDTPVKVLGISNPEAITVADGFSCARHSANKASCWGNNASGQLGDGTTTERHTPVQVINVTNIEDVMADNSGACMRTNDGKVFCWGANENGVLGDNSTVIRSPAPVEVINLGATASKIALGDGRHRCAMLSSGLVRCWGYNGNGQLGRNIDPHIPNDVIGLYDATDISAGNAFSCALKNARKTVQCWGANSVGQLGNAGTSNSAISGSASIQDIFSHDNQTCARFDSGTVQCWGYNGFGQLGVTASGPVISRPITIAEFANPRDIALSARRTCAADRTGTVRCLGTTTDYAGTDNFPAPVVVDGVSTISSIVTGSDNTCAVTSGGFRCWGDAATSRPVAPGFDTNVVAMAARGFRTCLRTATGDIACNPDYQYLRPRNNSSDVVSGFANATQMAPGDTHICVLRNNNTVSCWGRNEQGQLGDGTNTDNINTPVTVVNATDAIAITSGSGHTCIIRKPNGNIACWGSNLWGQLGNGTLNASNQPVTVTDSNGEALTGAIGIAAGDRHTCANLADGSVRCWGDNSSGQLGDNSTTASAEPVTVTALTTATNIFAGDAHTCALLSDRQVRCWGENTYGQLGNGTLDNSSVPVDITGLVDVKSLATGSNHTCAQLDDGHAMCWGSNVSGQLGYTNGLPLSVLLQN